MKRTLNIPRLNEKNVMVSKKDNRFDQLKKLPSKEYNSTTDTIDFFQLDIDYNNAVLDSKYLYLPHNEPSTEKEPLINIYGITSTGDSILAIIHGYQPYFYIPFSSRNEPTKDDLAKLKQQCEDAMKRAVKNVDGDGTFMVSVTILADHHSLMHYHFQENQYFIKLTLRLPKFVPILRGLLSDGSVDQKRHTTYESDLLFVLRFMVDKKIAGCSWLRAAASHYVLAQPDEQKSKCALEIHVHAEDLISLGVDNEFSSIPPLRILSFDIECSGRPGSFPTPDLDEVIQIANYVVEVGNPVPIMKNVFVLRGCSDIPGADIFGFKTEAEMLQAWSDFVNAIDVDIFTGYNIMNFDFHYLFERAKILKLNDFGKISRIKHDKVSTRSTVFQSKAVGQRDSKELFNMSGRVAFDMFQVIQQNYKLRSYSLNFVSSNFLGDQKEEVHYSDITKFHNGSDDDRAVIAVYCLKDTYLPIQLLDKLMSLVNGVEMCRVTGIPLSYLLPRGQQVKVITQLYRYANASNLLIPYYTRSGGSSEKFKGATVIKPLKGFYREPIATLDFSSLYPSVMIAHNTCYSTLLPNIRGPQNSTLDDIPDIESKLKEYQLTKDDVELSPNGDVFVKSEKKKGILPEILQHLLSARRQAKKDMAVEKDEFRKNVLNGRQLALKISANSVYGFTGAQVGKLPCMAIAQSVTSYGRAMIDLTKDTVEKHYCIKNGYKWDAVVVYGDTDSVMVKFGTKDLRESIELGKEAAKFVTQRFPPPINLEFEKVFYPYLLISKKRYAGLFYNNADKYDHLDTKGIETVRRDNCQLVKYVLDNVLNKILLESDVNGAIQFTKDTIAQLLQNKLDLSLLIISKALSKEEYAGKQAHVELVKRIRARDKSASINLGDRIPYVITKAAKGAKAYEKAEDPLYALENNIPLDYDYYIDNQLKKPLTRIFKPILGDKVEMLFKGEHTRYVVNVIPTQQSGILKFTKVTKRCINCHAPIKNNEGTLCRSCHDKTGEIYAKRIEEVRSAESAFHRVMTQCQECMRSHHREIICSNKDCPIFYMRVKVQQVIDDKRSLIENFEW
ncbi:DNA polymerase [Entamoeba marina]